MVRLAESAGVRNPERLAVAAIRETYEETGLWIGEHIAGRLRPNLQCLEYLARAITPASSPIRYNARFFMAEAINTGFWAFAMAVFMSTPSHPNSIAIAASDAVPTPASTSIGMEALLTIVLIL